MEQEATMSRRAEYAEATRRAIIAAARELFAKRGYTATKVVEVAALARCRWRRYAVAVSRLVTLVDDGHRRRGRRRLSPSNRRTPLSRPDTVPLTRRMRTGVM
jgi:hypothetical protein